MYKKHITSNYTRLTKKNSDLVKAKKHLGQHFLINLDISRHIVDSLINCVNVLEIGPGMGVLTQHLISNSDISLQVIELDDESIAYLRNKYPRELENKIIKGDFLKLDLSTIFDSPFSIIGNFPYNISSQIFFHLLEYKNQVTQVVCMLQKEVAIRLCASATGKEYGILSVLLQSYYDIEYLFDVAPENFNPPPKVQSGVIKLTRNNVLSLDCDEILMKKIIKATFNQRRKTIRNSLCSLYPHLKNEHYKFFSHRPERLSVSNFVELTQWVSSKLN